MTVIDNKNTNFAGTVFFGQRFFFENYHEKKFSRLFQMEILANTYLYLSAAADFEYYERELSSALTSNQHVQSIFHTIRNDRDARLCESEDGESNRSCHQTHDHRKDKQTVFRLERKLILFH